MKPRTLALLAIVICALCVRRSSGAAETPAFRFERAVAPSKAPGPQHLPVDVALLAGAEPGRGLADLRLFDAAGRELGYLLVAPPPQVQGWQEAKALPGRETRDESGFEADLGEVVTVDRVRLSGLRAPFVKRARLEGSADREHWVTLAADETLFDLPDDGLQRLELGFTPGAFRYLHLTWDDHSSARVRVPHVSLRLQRDALARAPLYATVPFERRASEPRMSRFRLRLPGVELPIVALEVDCGGTALLRPAKVLEPRLLGNEVTPAIIGTGTLRRAVHDGLVAADLRVPIGRVTGADLDLVVDDGDNPPLDVTAVRAVFAPQPWIYFETNEAGPVVARFGNAKLSAPRYDLEAMRGVASSRPAAAASWGDPRPVIPGAASPASTEEYPLEGSALDKTGFAYRREIAAGKRGLTAVLMDAAILAHAHGFDDVRIVDAAGHQVPYLLEKRDEPISLSLSLASEPARASGPVPGESRYRITLPYATLPPSRLLVSSPARVFERELRLEADNPEPLAPRAPPTRVVGAVHWSHSDPETATPALVFPLPPLGVDRVVLDVEEGDNRALEVSHAELLLPASRLRFFRANDGDLTLLYGRGDLAAPRYDLALLAPRLVGMVADEVTLGPEVVGSLPVAPSTAPKSAFWAALVVAVLVLLVLIVRLISKTEVA